VTNLHSKIKTFQWLFLLILLILSGGWQDFLASVMLDLQSFCVVLVCRIPQIISLFWQPLITFRTVISPESLIYHLTRKKSASSGKFFICWCNFSGSLVNTCRWTCLKSRGPLFWNKISLPKFWQKENFY